jgi:hypothetical protein
VTGVQRHFGLAKALVICLSGKLTVAHVVEERCVRERVQRWRKGGTFV